MARMPALGTGVGPDRDPGMTEGGDPLRGSLGTGSVDIPCHHPRTSRSKGHRESLADAGAGASDDGHTLIDFHDFSSCVPGRFRKWFAGRLFRGDVVVVERVGLDLPHFHPSKARVCKHRGGQLVSPHTAQPGAAVG